MIGLAQKGAIAGFPDGTFIAMKMAVGANYSDAGGGMNLQNVMLTINGQNVTPMCEITPTSIRYVHPIPFHSNTINMCLVLVDQAGNSTPAVWSVSFRWIVRLAPLGVS